MFKAFSELPKWLRLAIVFPILFLNGFLFVLLLNYFRTLVTYFIIANLLAFLLELALQSLQDRGVARKWAVTIVLLSTLFMVAVSAFILLPLMTTQLNDLLTKAPHWFEETRQKLYNLSESPLLRKLPIDLGKNATKTVENFFERIEGVATHVLVLLAGTLGRLFDTLIVLLFTIFLLAAGDRFWRGILSWLPEPWDRKIPLYTEKTFKDYFYSRLILAGISTAACILVFLLLGIPYPALFALALGISSLIPVVSGILGILLTALLCLNSLAMGFKFFISASIISQIVDNVIAPRLMGDLIGLNPIWLLISLFIGAQIGGILGLLLAVPVASVIKQIIEDLRVSPV